MEMEQQLNASWFYIKFKFLENYIYYCDQHFVLRIYDDEMPK